MALQSPVGISSSYRPETSVLSRQPGPTYTTAGTIYNPNSSQPLQPPTRRGRSLKWNSALPPDLALLPKSMLSALPLHPHGSTRSVPPPQYSPLQQNYDRAISPSIDAGKPAMDGVTAQTPRLFAASMHPESPNDPKKQSQSSDDEDEDIELRMKPLLNMPVKSLHNLASYPNPNQKIAQKVILRGVRPNLASTTMLGPDSFGPNSTGAHEESVMGRREPPPHVTPTILKPANIGSSTEMGKRSRHDLQFMNHGQMRASLNRSNTEGSLQETQPGYTTLASGPGAPRPLTAGPPGQRQYRPSTFDTTFKALRSKEMSFGMRDGASSPQNDHDAVSSNMSEAATTSRDYMSGLLGDSIAFDPKNDFGTDGISWPHTDESPTWRSEHSQPYLHGQMLSTNGHNANRTLSPLAAAYPMVRQSDPRSYAEAFHTAEEKVSDRLTSVTSAWQSGQFSALAADSRGGAKSSPLGAIGDKCFPRGEFVGDRGDHLSMDEANKLTAAEHSKPLLELVLASLERNLSWSHFSTPDPSLIDDTPEGNKSLFGKSQRKNKNGW